MQVKDDFKIALTLFTMMVSLIFWVANLHFEVQANTAWRKDFPSSDWFELKFDEMEKTITEIKAKK